MRDSSQGDALFSCHNAWSNAGTFPHYVSMHAYMYVCTCVCMLHIYVHVWHEMVWYDMIWRRCASVSLIGPSVAGLISTINDMSDVLVFEPDNQLLFDSTCYVSLVHP